MKNKFDWGTECKDFADYIAVFVVILLVLGVMILALFGQVWILQLLWNFCLVAIIPIAPISYWQMWGIYLICRLLFGSVAYVNRMDK